MLVHTANTDKTKLSRLVRVGGVNKLLRNCIPKYEQLTLNGTLVVR